MKWRYNTDLKQPRHYQRQQLETHGLRKPFQQPKKQPQKLYARRRHKSYSSRSDPLNSSSSSRKGAFKAAGLFKFCRSEDVSSVTATRFALTLLRAAKAPYASVIWTLHCNRPSRHCHRVFLRMICLPKRFARGTTTTSGTTEKAPTLTQEALPQLIYIKTKQPNRENWTSTPDTRQDLQKMTKQ